MMTPERLAVLRERAKAYRSRPLAFNEAQHVANHALAADAAESLPEALDEVERLRAALHAVAHDPHQSYEAHGPVRSEGDRQYQIGVADGHRCAGNTARRALGEAVDG